MKKSMFRITAVLMAILMVFAIVPVGVSGRGYYPSTNYYNTERVHISTEYIFGNDTLNQLSLIDFGREVEFFTLESNSPNTRHQDDMETLLHFDTIEEFVEFVSASISFIESVVNNDIVSYNDFSYEGVGLSPFAGSTFHRFRVWRPNILSTWAWHEITFTTENLNGQPFRSHIMGSNIVGLIVGLSWEHAWGNAQTWSNFSGVRVELEVHGHWLISASIGGVVSVPVGVRIADVWRHTAHFNGMSMQ